MQIACQWPTMPTMLISQSSLKKWKILVLGFKMSRIEFKFQRLKFKLLVSAVATLYWLLISRNSCR